MIPIKKIQPNTRTKSWISESTKKLITKRDYLRKKAITSYTVEDWMEFRKCRNQVTDRVEKDRKNYFENLYSVIDKNRDTRSLYRLTKEKLGWKTSGPPTNLMDNGKLLSKPIEIANCLNLYFTENIRILKENIPVSRQDPLKILRSAIDNWEGAAGRSGSNKHRSRYSSILHPRMEGWITCCRTDRPTQCSWS